MTKKNPGEKLTGENLMRELLTMERSLAKRSPQKWRMRANPDKRSPRSNGHTIAPRKQSK